MRPFTGTGSTGLEISVLPVPGRASQLLAAATLHSHCCCLPAGMFADIRHLAALYDDVATPETFADHVDPVYTPITEHGEPWTLTHHFSRSGTCSRQNGRTLCSQWCDDTFPRDHIIYRWLGTEHGAVDYVNACEAAEWKRDRVGRGNPASHQEEWVRTSARPGASTW